MQTTIDTGIAELFDALPEVLTVEEIAATVRVTPSTVLRWHHEEGLRAVQIGSRVFRFLKEDVITFCTTHC